jgi:hypothetical protein
VAWNTKPGRLAAGETWWQVAGTFDPVRHWLLLGAGDPGSYSVALHETGHAIGQLLGYDNSPQLAYLHRKMYRKLDPYFQGTGPDDPNGRKELLAEGIAIYLIRGRQFTAREFSPAFARFIRHTVFQSGG